MAKLADRRLRIYEAEICYSPRTYEEGKKVGVADGFRAVYCIAKYNAPSAPSGIQFLLYCVIGGFSGIVNLAVFAILLGLEVGISVAAPIAFGIAALVNYQLCIAFLFQRNIRWARRIEWAVYAGVVVGIGYFDFLLTRNLIESGMGPLLSKVVAAASLPVLNFVARRYLVFQAKRRGPWKPTHDELGRAD